MPDETFVPSHSGRDESVRIPQRGLAANDTDEQLLQKARDVAPFAVRKYLLEHGFDIEWLSSPDLLKSEVAATIRRELPPQVGPDYGARLETALDQALTESIQTLSGQVGAVQNALEGLRTFGTLIINALEEAATLSTEVAADPITPRNGQFVHTATDFAISGAGMDFHFARTYKNQAAYLGPLGYSWDHSYNLWVRRSEDGQRLFRSTGALREDEFRRHPDFDYFSPPDGATSIFEDIGGALSLRTEAGVRYHYGRQHTDQPLVFLITKIEDIFGNHLTFDYTENLISRVRINSDHRFVRFFYNDDKRIQRLQDHTGRVWDYCYDDLGDLIEVIGPPGGSNQERRCTRFEYSSNGSVGGVSHNLLRIFDAKGQLYLENEYGTNPNRLSYNRVVRQRLGPGDFLFEYSDVYPEFRSELPDHLRPTSETVITDPRGHQLRQVFNRFGNLLLRDECIVMEGVPRLVRSYFRYNKDGLRIASLSPEGVMRQHMYGRDVFLRERNLPASADVSAHPDLTLSERQGFQRLSVSVDRNRRFRFEDLLQANAVWGDVFPDIVSVRDLDPDGNAEDRIRKFTYETEFGRTLTESDPRYTNSADPNRISLVDGEHPRFEATLTRFQYDEPVTGENRFLVKIHHPEITTADGQADPTLSEDFTNEDGTPAYDARGRLLRYKDTLGTTTVFEYFTDIAATEGYLKSKTIDPDGLKITTRNHMDPLGRITSRELPKSFVPSNAVVATTYEHDAYDNIVRIVGPAPFHYTKSFKYDQVGLLCETRTELKDSDGREQLGGVSLEVNHYDALSNVTESTFGSLDTGDHIVTQHQYDPLGNLTLTISPNGNYMQHAYDERSLPTHSTAGNSVVSITGERTFYDGDGNVVRLVDALGNTTRTSYDTFGQVIEIEDAVGTITRFDYDKIGNLICTRKFAKDGDSYFLVRRSEAQFDELKRPVREASSLFVDPVGPFARVDLPAAELATPGPGQLVWTRTLYDPVNRKEIQVAHTGLRRETVFDAAGRAIGMIDPIGNQVSTIHDQHSNIVRTDLMFAERDDQGSIVAREFFVETSEFDALDRPISRTDSLGNTTRLFYDSRSNVTKILDPLGNEIRAAFDVFNRAVSTSRVMTESGIGPDDGNASLITSHNDYDPNGNLIRAIDPMGRATTYQYDALDRNYAVTFPDGSGARTEYDANGNVVATTDPRGVRRSFDLDPFGRRTSIQVDAGAAAHPVLGAIFSRSEYDALGRQTRVENDVSIVTKKFNSFDQTIEETSQILVDGLARAQPLVIRRTFGEHGEISEVAYPSGRQVRLNRDELNRVTGLENLTNGQNYPGDAALPDGRPLVEFSYHCGRRVQSAFANGVSTSLRYDGAGRLLDLSHATDTSTHLATTYLYDAAGNLRVRQNAELGDRMSETYAYDSRYQLTNLSQLNSPNPLDINGIGPSTAPIPTGAVPNGQASIDVLAATLGPPSPPPIFDYDANQNRVSQDTNTGSTQYVTNDLDQYQTIGTTAYRFDAAGNVIGDDRHTYFYDSLNRLVEVRDLNGIQISQFWHDAFGRRVAQHSNGEARELVYDRLDVIEEYVDQTCVAQYVHDVGIDQPVHMAANGRDHWYHSDLIGSVRLLTDTNGHVIARYRYLPFGEAAQELEDGVSNPYRYAGRRLDREIASYDFRARQYDAEIGRFLQRDPSGTQDGTNVYAYCGNNPLTHSDPTGTSRQESSTSWSSVFTGGLGALREGVKPTLKTGGKPQGWLHLWTNTDGKPRLGYAEAADAISRNAKRGDWMFDMTTLHSRATQAANEVWAANPSWPKRLAPNLYNSMIDEPIWIPASRKLAGRAGFAQLPYQAHNAVDPDKIQVKHEIPMAKRWGLVSSFLSAFSGGLNILSGATSDNALVQTTGVVAGTAEVTGSGIFLTGMLSGNPELASWGAKFIRVGGGVATVFLSGHQFINDARNGNMADSVGSASSTGTGIAMILGSGIGTLVLGEFTAVYEGSRLISRKTGWGDSSGEEGAYVAQWMQGKDPGMVRNGAAHTAGFLVTASGVLVREPLGALDSAIMPEGRTLSLVVGAKHLLRWENPLW